MAIITWKMKDHGKNYNEQLNNSLNSINDKYFLPQEDGLLGLEVPENEVPLDYSQSEISLPESDLESVTDESLSERDFADDYTLESASTFQTLTHTYFFARLLTFSKKVSLTGWLYFFAFNTSCNAKLYLPKESLLCDLKK